MTQRAFDLTTALVLWPAGRAAALVTKERSATVGSGRSLCHALSRPSVGGGRPHGSDDAQVEPREVAVGRRAIASVGLPTTGSPRSRSCAPPRPRCRSQTGGATRAPLPLEASGRSTPPVTAFDGWRSSWRTIASIAVTVPRRLAQSRHLNHADRGGRALGARLPSRRRIVGRAAEPARAMPLRTRQFGGTPAFPPVTSGFRRCGPVGVGAHDRR